jgi:hypothetical protein
LDVAWSSCPQDSLTHVRNYHTASRDLKIRRNSELNNSSRILSFASFSGSAVRDICHLTLDISWPILPTGVLRRNFLDRIPAADDAYCAATRRARSLTSGRAR